MVSLNEQRSPALCIESICKPSYIDLFALESTPQSSKSAVRGLLAIHLICPENIFPIRVQLLPRLLPGMVVFWHIFVLPGLMYNPA